MKEYSQQELFALYFPVQGIPCPLIFYPINLITENMTKKIILNPLLEPYQNNSLVFGLTLIVEVTAVMFWSQNFLFYIVLNSLTSLKLERDLKNVDNIIRYCI